MLVAELLQLLVVVAEPNRRRGWHSGDRQPGVHSYELCST